MQESKPSRTALRVAIRRAMHQLKDKPVVFHDPVAVPLLGERHADDLWQAMSGREHAFLVALRAFLVARSRFAEDNLARAVKQGLRQYVLLGAGLDTFAYRNPYPGLRVFEVDHPATQGWKRELLEAGGITATEELTFVPVDFEHQSLATELELAGFDASAPAFFAWLGVVPYLTREAFRATLSYIAGQTAGSGVVLDYGLPRQALPFIERMGHDALRARVAKAGEPFQLFFTPAEMAAELAAFPAREDLGSTEINARYFAGRQDELCARGSAGRIVAGWK